VGVLHHEITGHSLDIETLRDMAARGEPYLMLDENGYLRDWWFIESVEETGSEFFQDGRPRKIEFSLQLKRDDRPSTPGGYALASLF
jgi:phage protein U